MLEEAYPKFYRSYQALESGTAIEATVDFSGGIPKYVDISHMGLDHEDGDEEMEASVCDIFLSLDRAFERDAFLSCSMGVRVWQFKIMIMNTEP